MHTYMHACISVPAPLSTRGSALGIGSEGWVPVVVNTYKINKHLNLKKTYYNINGNILIHKINTIK